MKRIESIEILGKIWVSNDSGYRPGKRRLLILVYRSQLHAVDHSVAGENIGHDNDLVARKKVPALNELLDSSGHSRFWLCAEDHLEGNDSVVEPQLPDGLLRVRECEDS